MKKEQIIFFVKEHTGSSAALSASEGDRINVLLDALLLEYETIYVDFEGITIFSTSFVNAAIGQLYKENEADQINNRIQLIHIDADDLPLFKQVIATANNYFKDSNPIQTATNKIIGYDRD